MRKVPGPVLERLAHLYTILSRLEPAKGRRSLLSSKTLGELIAVPDHTIRKDLSLLRSALDEEGARRFADAGTEQGYDASLLKEAIESCLGLSVRRAACLVGLGRLGEAILHRQIWVAGAHDLAAGFDASVNRIELVSTRVPLYHSKDIARIVREKNIRIGIIAVPAEAAQEAADRLCDGGIQGIVNLAPVILAMTGRNVIVRNISLQGELHVISAYLYMQGE